MHDTVRPLFLSMVNFGVAGAGLEEQQGVLYGEGVCVWVWKGSFLKMSINLLNEGLLFANRSPFALSIWFG